MLAEFGLKIASSHMPLISLITDYGTQDFYVGSLKGNLYSACGDILLVDITHEIPRHKLIQAAYVLKSCFADFPEGSFHLVLTDTEKDGGKPVLFKYKSHFFLGIDNGLFNMFTDGESPDWIIELDPEKVKCELRNLNKFFSAVIALLIEGVSAKDLGKVSNKLLSVNAPRPAYGDWGIRGEVIYIDKYENAVLNIDKELFDNQCSGKTFSIEFKSLDKLNVISNGYSDLPPGELLAFFNNSGYLEIAVNHGKAASLLGLKLETKVQIDLR